MFKYSKISELKPLQKNVFIASAEIIQCSELKEINIKGSPVKVVDAIVKDETGQIRISAFGFVSQFLHMGARIKIENCFCKLYNGEDKKDGELQISTGYFGRIVKLS